MFIVDTLSRWLHILPALALVGGTIFMRFAYVPSLGSLADDARDELRSQVRSRWAKVVMLSIALLLLSGLYNTAMISMNYKVPGYYHGLLGAKILLALMIFFIASVLAGRSSLAEKFRTNELLWLNVNIVLMVVLVCIAGAMKQIDKPPKDDSSESSSYSTPFEPPARG